MTFGYRVDWKDKTGHTTVYVSGGESPKEVRQQAHETAKELGRKPTSLSWFWNWRVKRKSTAKCLRV